MSLDLTSLYKMVEHTISELDGDPHRRALCKHLQEALHYADAHPPRVVVEVSGGVADAHDHGGAESYVVDWDNIEEDPDAAEDVPEWVRVLLSEDDRKELIRFART